MNHAKKTIALHALAMAALAVKAGSAVIRNDAELAAIQNLKSRLGELSETSRAIQAKADAEKRDLNADEQKELDACLEEFDQVEADIGRRERIVAQAGRLATPTARVTQPDPVVVTDPVQQPTNNARPSSGVGRDGLRNTRVSTLEERQRWGFTNMGDFAIAVRGAVLNPSNIDGRLTNAAAITYGSEAVGADGGFAVPPEWRAEIMKQVDAEDGFLSITGRKKELIVTAGGKNVAPTALEDPLRANPLVGQAVVIGDQRPFVAALISLDPEMLPIWLSNNGLDKGLSLAQAAKEPKVLAEIQSAVDRVNKNFSKAESIRKFTVIGQELSEESGHLTPSLKIKRESVMRDFGPALDEIYNSGPATSETKAI